jgi:hypothetical protein
MVAATEKPLTNDDVVALKNAGMGEAVVVSKIKQAAAVAFDLSTEALIKLKKDGVPQSVITAMLDRTSETQTQAAVPASRQASGESAVGSWIVRITTGANHYDLLKMQGTADHGFKRLGTTTFHNFPGVRAVVRIHDRNPEILVASASQPVGQFFIVKAESDPKSGNRSVKVGHGFMGMTDSTSPDPDWTIRYEASQVSPGVWRLKASKPLDAGEYGVYVANGNLLGVGEIYDFGVDN